MVMVLGYGSPEKPMQMPYGKMKPKAKHRASGPGSQIAKDPPSSAMNCSDPLFVPVSLNVEAGVCRLAITDPSEIVADRQLIDSLSILQGSGGKS